MKSQSKTKISLIWIAVLSLAFLGAVAALDQGVLAADIGPSAGIQATPVTVITVDSGTDPDTSKSTTCTSTPCTLRRAIVQARLLAPEDRPVLIQFNIPATPAEGYNSILGIWKLHIQSTSDPSVFRYLDGGQVVIDGTTQPGGTTSGPKIFIVGPSTGNKTGLIIGTNPDGLHDNNEIRGLAFQNFTTHLTINSNNNLIEDNWFGLSDNGMAAFLRDDDPQDGSGVGGISLSAGVSGNLIDQNHFLGFDGTAITLRGDTNTFSNNSVGTAADGTLPGKQTNPSLICTSVDWLGGGGVSIQGNDQTVQDNVIAGLRQEIFTGSTQPDAIMVTGTGHLVQDNSIGVNNLNSKVGVCGRGIYLSGGPKEIQVIDNRIINPELSGISLNGVLYDENTLQMNIIEKTTAWPEVDGSLEPENAIQVGPSMTEAFRAFLPAKVTEINGTSVSGNSGDGSPCPNCIVEIFLDDKDGIVETLQSLAVVTAGANGNWNATLPFELSSGQGLRTISTTAQYNTIPNMSAGTTTQLSELYSSASGGAIYLPLVIK